MHAKSPFSSVHIIGAGLIGTSIGLSLKNHGATVTFEDLDSSNAQLAQDLVGPTASNPNDPEVVVVATPISAIPGLIKSASSRFPESTLIDIGGIKSQVINELEGLSGKFENYVSVHPMAGRELTGPGSARADLFDGRAWIVTPTSGSSATAVSRAKALGELLGATTYLMSPDQHDKAIGLVSHLPQMLASLLGSTLSEAPEEQLTLAGQGLRDTARLAASDSDFWTELLLANAGRDSELLIALAEVANKLARALDDQNAAAVKEILESGRLGHSRIPGKHGARSRNYTYLPVVIQDAPGQLAALFEECAHAGVNVEDLSIEHSPGQATGLITLALSDADAANLQKHLTESGWSAHQPRK